MRIPNEEIKRQGVAGVIELSWREAVNFVNVLNVACLVLKAICRPVAAVLLDYAQELLDVM